MRAFPYQIIDLTHPLSEDMPSWEGEGGFHSEILLEDIDGHSDVKFRVQQIKMDAGMGTHIDAPAHCVPNGVTIDALPLENLMVPGVVIDVSTFMHAEYRLSVADMERFEREYGKLKPGNFVVIRTGWEQFWMDPSRYHNQHVFPSVSKEAAEFLLEKKVVGLGIDTLSPDKPCDGFPVHAAFLGAGKYIVENMAHLDRLPPYGSFILALPLKLKGGTEAPIRCVALIPTKSFRKPFSDHH